MGEFENHAAAAEAAAGLDAWLRGGGLVVAASERAGRAVRAAFHRARRAQGLAAWPAPDVRDWNSFVRGAWQEIGRDDRLVLSAFQEQTLWAEVIGASSEGRGLFDGPRQRLAAMAMHAYGLLCAYAPRYLEARARAAWQQDAAVFSAWMAAFEDSCRSLKASSGALVPGQLIRALQDGSAERPPLVLVAFDRLMPVQRKVFDAWGRWKPAQPGAAAAQVRVYEANDARAELEACALWCQGKIAERPGVRLLIVAQNLAQDRGEIERALLRHTGANLAAPGFEFSLGVPLGSVALARGARLLLRWLSGPLEEREVDWLFSTGQTTRDLAEQYALTGFMRAVRRKNRQRVQWMFEELSAQRAAAELPGSWVERMRAARKRLGEVLRRAQTPLAWAELIPELLRCAGWPHPEGSRRSLASTEFQALRRWQQALDECASLGFDGRRIGWNEFLAALGRVLEQTLFAPESEDAPIQIAEPAESAGLTADAIWFLGAGDDAWPGSDSMNPLLPIEVAREAMMPHASARLDWELARAVTARLLASAPEVCFGYARQRQGVETRASRIVTAVAGAPQPLPRELTSEDAPKPITVVFRDESRVPLRIGKAAGGAAVLTAQSQCPFKAFATARLDAQGWELAQAGLTAAQRGSLLHAVMHSVWGGAATAGIRSHAELAAIADLPAFVEEHVRHAAAEDLPAAAREQMPRGYLELEAVRLIQLVADWLEFERARAPFTVAGTEVEKDVTIAGLHLNLRLDRMDRLSDGAALVIDYKTGKVSPKLWELPRPDDVQLPVYAGFALDPEIEPLTGLVFAKVRADAAEFVGRVADARGTLLPGVGASKQLAKKPLAAVELAAWRGYIERLARDFLAGRADVDPREYPTTCERCGLQALCRVRENHALVEVADGEGSGDE